MIRLLLVLAFVLLLLPGCKTTWGGDPITSLKSLNEKETNSVNEMEQQGQITKVEADAMRQSIDSASTPAGQ